MGNRIIDLPIYTHNIASYAALHDLVLLDLDEVVLIPQHLACSGTWMTKNHFPLNKHVPPSKLLNDFHSCSNSTTYVAVSPQLVEDFSQLAKLHLVLGLTARMMCHSEKTKNQVSSVGMTFSDVTESMFIKQGVIYAGYNYSIMMPNNKGTVLTQLINQGLFGNINSIFFIDDSRRNLEEVMTFLPPEILFTGVHFTSAYDRLLSEFPGKMFDLVGDCQFKALTSVGSLPSNEECIYITN